MGREGARRKEPTVAAMIPIDAVHVGKSIGKIGVKDDR